MADAFALIIDIGKTISKVSAWSRAGECVARITRSNEALPAAPYAPLDTSATADWLIETLREFSGQPIEAIIPVAHGAAVAGIVPGSSLPLPSGEGVGGWGSEAADPRSPDASVTGVEPPPQPLPTGEGLFERRTNAVLAFTPPDYEWPIPADVLQQYRAQRDAFAITGSPALPGGLNMAAQLHYLETQAPLDQVTLLPYAQYWAWLLSGVAASEVTSLGCHSDLWEPGAADFSPMAKARGWAGQFAPLARAGDVVGTLLPELAARTGLSPQVRIHAGLHDSNAALHAARGFAEVAGQDATVLSTGTWFVAMRVQGQSSPLPEQRDCLVNVDPFGQPVPSARFMGGREIELLGARIDQPGLAGLDEALAQGAMVLPAVVPGSGPFPDHAHAWLNESANSESRIAAAALYAALMADTALNLIGSRERLVIEGRFAGSEIFVRALASLRSGTQVFAAPGALDASFGALRLIDPGLKPGANLARVAPLPHDISAYCQQWKERVREQR